MGFLTNDFIPAGAYGPTAITPPGRDQRVKVAVVSRTDTAVTPKMVIRGGASVYGLRVFGSVASNAGTSATVTFTIANNGGTVSTGSYDVKTNGAVSGFVNLTNLPNAQAVPVNGDLTISVQYAETGTASTTGGPWNFLVEYVD